MDTYRIIVKKGAEVVHQASGKTYTMDRQLLTNAERDPNSGCMLFRTGINLYYVSEDYKIVRKIEESPNA